ncbi:hypothetical protein HPB48_026479 [Haemaphysalis longicornis]|uniref:UBC core domain-containing protein n=1 Tax=Haemaphysalis longicornis TaxID=44386 RepID=A0A9J6H178_HAELO|nr:hypothetical protein HPB48_026479 [Haemaphysalis longicornis]
MRRDSFLKMASQNVDDTASAGMATADGDQPGQVCGSDVPAAGKRLRLELLALMTSRDAMISAFPEDRDIFDWVATIHGPAGTAYENLVYRLRMKFPPNYPCAGPVVQFETPCFHPNVDDLGNICLDILKDQWTALLDVRTVLLSIQSLLAEPNVASPLNAYAAEIWTNQELYKKAVLEKYGMTTKGAGESPE